MVGIVSFWYLELGLPGGLPAWLFSVSQLLGLSVEKQEEFEFVLWGLKQCRKLVHPHAAVTLNNMLTFGGFQFISRPWE